MTAFILLLILAAVLGGPAGIAWLLGLALIAYLLFTAGVLVVCAVGEIQDFIEKLTARKAPQQPGPKARR